MNIKRILDINDAIKKALPQNYHRPRLALFEDEDHIAKVNDINNKKIVLFAVYDPNVDTINLPIREALTLSDLDLAKVLLHEYGHCYFGYRYGFNSKQYVDEVACDKFAYRYINKLNITLKADNKRFCGWREEEIAYLRSKYPNESKDKIIQRLGRTWFAIKTKASLLKITRNK